MALDKPTSNKMMTAAPAKKGWHFPSDGVHAAEFIYAETIQEAEEVYHKIKQRLVIPTGHPIVSAEQSTGTAPENDQGVQSN